MTQFPCNRKRDRSQFKANPIYALIRASGPAWTGRIAPKVEESFILNSFRMGSGSYAFDIQILQQVG